jgi:hypothetical protein
VFVSGGGEPAKAEAGGLPHDLGGKDQGIIDPGRIQTARGPENYSPAEKAWGRRPPRNGC